jgi:4-diphosphocytidyl-2-C-methyl-D-erythritol kinase
MLPIGIYDNLEVALRPDEPGVVSLECDHPAVPGDAGNLAWRAAALYLERAPGWRTGIHIRLEKDIPVGAGLGGGSADAGAVLLALNYLSPSPLSKTALQELARVLGADVPFFLVQAPCLATGIGEKLQRVEGLPKYPLVLIKPSMSVSTKRVYQKLKLTRGEGRIKIEGLLKRPWNLSQVLENDLESVTLVDYPVLESIKAWLAGQGALGALMSGSGPTIFGVFPNACEAEKVGLLARQIWRDCWVGITEVQGTAST